MSNNALAFQRKGLRLTLLCLAVGLGLVSSSWRSAVSLAAPLRQSNQISFGQSFSPNSIAVGAVSTVVFTISNNGSQPASDLAFTDNLPAGVTVAAAAGASTTCDGATLSAVAGASTVTLSGARLGSGQSCTVSVNVTASNAGSFVNTTGDLTSSLGNSGTSSATLTADANRPTFTKTFAPATIGVNQISRLSFIIDNSAGASAASAVTFVDNLPTGMVVATPPNATIDSTANCSWVINNLVLSAATLTATAGSSTVSFSGYVPTGSVCSFSVDVTANLVGSLENTTNSLSTSFGASGKAGAVLEVTRSLLGILFTDDPAAPGAQTTLEFTLSNFDRSGSLTDIAFTNDLDAALSGLTAVGLPLTNPCGTGSQISGTSTLTFSGGNLSPEATCTFSVTLQVPSAAAASVYTNTTSAVTAQLDGSPVNAVAATDRLVVSALPQLTKTAVPAIVQAGASVDVVYTITNTDQLTTASSIAFTDNLSDLLPGAIPSLPSNGYCGPSSMISASNNNGVITLNVANASLDAATSCSFAVTFTVPSSARNGAYSSTTSSISAVIGGESVTGHAATGGLTVVAAPFLSKTFLENPVSAGDTVALQYTLSHDENATADATDITFTDDLDAALTGLVSTSPTQNNVCGTGSQLSGTSSLTLTGGSLAPGSTCSFSVTLQVPTGAAAGTYASASGDVTATLDKETVTGPGATVDLEVGSVVFTKRFTDSPTVPGATTALVFTITNNSPASSITSMSFTDSLSGVLSGLAASGLPVTDVCGAGSTIAGTSTLTFSGGSLAPGSSCTFTVTVQIPTSAAAGEYTNLTSQLSGTLEASPFQVDPADDTLQIVDVLSFSKEFLDDPVPAGSTVVLSFTITNSHPSAQATGLTFTDDLDAALTGLMATGLPANDVCGTGSQLSGTDLLTLSGGVLAANSSCTFSVTLQVPAGATPGAYPNTTSTVTATLGGSPYVGPPASESLFVSGAPTLTKSFPTNPVGAGDIATMRFELTNNSAVSPATGIGFTDNLSLFISGASIASLPAAGFCGPGSVATATLVIGELVLNVTGASLPAGGSCTFDVGVTIQPGTPTGSYLNTTSIVSASATGQAASATLDVVAAPRLQKEFTDDPTLPGGTVTLQFTVENDENSPATAVDIAFTDDLDATLTGLVATGLPANDICGVGSTLSGTSTLTFTGGTLAPGTTCTFSVTLQVPAGALPGNYPNLTSD
ncbi:MAG: DUF11 domain-containing protein, partial [Caldilineaceae bacterium]|nr:DUF11 domain-containing protein [Caldilineaceae bacterium]